LLSEGRAGRGVERDTELLTTRQRATKEYVGSVSRRVWAGDTDKASTKSKICRKGRWKKQVDLCIIALGRKELQEKENSGGLLDERKWIPN